MKSHIWLKILLGGENYPSWLCNASILSWASAIAELSWYTKADVGIELVEFVYELLVGICATVWEWFLFALPLTTEVIVFVVVKPVPKRLNKYLTFLIICVNLVKIVLWLSVTKIGSTLVQVVALAWATSDETYLFADVVSIVPVGEMEI